MQCTNNPYFSLLLIKPINVVTILVMQNDFFECDDKADANYRKHGVSFDETCTVFADDYMLSYPDNR